MAMTLTQRPVEPLYVSRLPAPPVTITAIWSSSSIGPSVGQPSFRPLGVSRLKHPIEPSLFVVAENEKTDCPVNVPSGLVAACRGAERTGRAGYDGRGVLSFESVVGRGCSAMLVRPEALAA